MPRAEEAIIPLPSPRSLVPRVTHVKSAWVGASLRSLRERDLLDRYFRMLPEGFHDAVKNTPPGEWLPLEVALAHYGALDRLEISVNDLVALGHAAIVHGHGTPISVSVKLAVGAGATPWTVLGQLQRFWDRSWLGGGVGAFKLGPKEARVEIVGWPVAQFRYTRVGMRGVIAGGLELFCQKIYVQEIADMCTPLTLGYRVSWV
jgi:hypothetical protein